MSLLQFRARLFLLSSKTCAAVVILGAIAIYTSSPAATDDFPEYKVIRANVTFWEKIYSTYRLNQAVIHDSEDLSRIYTVIKLQSQSGNGPNSHNSKLQRQAIKKYKRILSQLATRKPRTPEEKRVAALFTGKNKQKTMARAAQNVRSQTGQKERFQRGVIRSGAFMTEIKRIFKSYRLPEELCYLPHVESSFNTRAYSKFGAAGIWQFTRATGKQYLKINYALDERLDPILASHAAAKYLKNSYRNLGNWPLAITSYNYGLSGMLRAKKELGSYAKIFQKYRKGHFKFASKNFYAEFLAALKVAVRLEKKLQLQPTQSTKRVKLSGFVDSRDISKHLGVEKSDIQKLNPALKSPVLNGEKYIPKGYSLRLPPEKKINTLLSSLPSSFYKKKQKPSLYHRVKKGETATSIAKLHKVSLKKLLKVNNLDKYATIYIRQKLRIPKIGVHSSTASGILRITAPHRNKRKFKLSSESIPIFSSNKKNRPTTKGFDLLPTKDPTVYNIQNIQNRDGKPSGVITVQPEESLRLYADWLGITRAALLRINRIKQDVIISPGQQLIIPLHTMKPEKFEEKRLDFLLETEEDFFTAYTVVGQKIYTVSQGDTLWDLCRNKFDIPLWLLERYNSTLDLAKLQNKQELIIPLVKSL